MNKRILDFLILAIIVIVFLWFLQKNKNEHLDSTPLSNEAIQSIASVYNKDNLTATNINATGTLNVGNGANKFQIIQFMQGDTSSLSILPLKPDGTLNWDNNILLRGGKDNNIWTNKNITTTESINATGNILGGGLIAEKDAYIKGVLSVGGQLNAPGGFKTPVDMTVRNANGWLALYNAADTRGRKTMCDDGYYVAGFIQDATSPQYAVYPQCRKLPGF